MLMEPSAAEQPPPDQLASIGRVFACFDRQDSGNVSFGVEADGRRWFVKTAGDPAAAAGVLPHGERVALLHNAERLARSVRHPALTRFEAVRASPWGPMLVYHWADGEHLHARRARRNDPDTPWQRFLSLPVEERIAAARVLVDLHLALSAAGWVTGDFYDGCLIYDFHRQALRVFDLDHYRQGAYKNDMGRMFGSTRFMARRSSRGAVSSTSEPRYSPWGAPWPFSWAIPWAASPPTSARRPAPTTLRGAIPPWPRWLRTSPGSRPSPEAGRVRRRPARRESE